jgi:hypothetical protein
MINKTYKIDLSSDAQLHVPVVKLEDMPVNLWSTDGGSTWSNDGVNCEVDGELNIYMSCTALSGTDWKFTVTDADSSKKVYDEEGTTGEKLASRKGKRIANFSERETTVEI